MLKRIFKKDLEGDSSSAEGPAVKANMGVKNDFYFNKELQQWVIRGKEDESLAKAGTAESPPPLITGTNNSQAVTPLGQKSGPTAQQPDMLLKALYPMPAYCNVKPPNVKSLKSPGLVQVVGGGAAVSAPLTPQSFQQWQPVNNNNSGSFDSSDHRGSVGGTVAIPRTLTSEGAEQLRSAQSPPIGLDIQGDARGAQESARGTQESARGTQESARVNYAGWSSGAEMTDYKFDAQESVSEDRRRSTEQPSLDDEGPSSSSCLVKESSPLAKESFLEEPAVGLRDDEHVWTSFGPGESPASNNDNAGGGGLPEVVETETEKQSECEPPKIHEATTIAEVGTAAHTTTSRTLLEGRTQAAREVTGASPKDYVRSLVGQVNRFRELVLRGKINSDSPQFQSVWRILTKEVQALCVSDAMTDSRPEIFSLLQTLKEINEMKVHRVAKPSRSDLLFDRITAELRDKVNRNLHSTENLQSPVFEKLRLAIATAKDDKHASVQKLRIALQEGADSAARMVVARIETMNQSFIDEAAGHVSAGITAEVKRSSDQCEDLMVAVLEQQCQSWVTKPKEVEHWVREEVSSVCSCAHDWKQRQVAAMSSGLDSIVRKVVRRLMRERLANQNREVTVEKKSRETEMGLRELDEHERALSSQRAEIERMRTEVERMRVQLEVERSEVERVREEVRSAEMCVEQGRLDLEKSFFARQSALQREDEQLQELSKGLREREAKAQRAEDEYERRTLQAESREAEAERLEAMLTEKADNLETKLRDLSNQLKLQQEARDDLGVLRQKFEAENMAWEEDKRRMESCRREVEESRQQVEETRRQQDEETRRQEFENQRLLEWEEKLQEAEANLERDGDGGGMTQQELLETVSGDPRGDGREEEFQQRVVAVMAAQEDLERRQARMAEGERSLEDRLKKLEHQEKRCVKISLMLKKQQEALGNKNPQ